MAPKSGELSRGVNSAANSRAEIVERWIGFALVPLPHAAASAARRARTAAWTASSRQRQPRQAGHLA